MGAESGEAAGVEFHGPKKDASRTLPCLIGRNSHRSGIPEAVSRIDAARSSVRSRQRSSSEQRAAYRSICSSVVFGIQRKWPGGLTATMTDRWMRFAWRHA